MTTYLLTALAAASAIVLAACSTETTRSDNASDEASAEDGGEDTADVNADAPPVSELDRERLAAIETNMREAAAQNFFEVRRFGLQPVGTDRYAGPITQYDPLLDQESELECTIGVTGEQVTESECREVGPAQRVRTSRGDVVIRATDRSEMREEIVREMQYNVAGGGRTNAPLRFSGEFPEFISLYRTTSADGSTSWQSGCAGRISEGQNGAQVASYICRQRP